jgi:hypothetical protein
LEGHQWPPDYVNIAAAEVHIEAKERLHEGPLQASSSSPLFFPLSMGLRKNSRPSYRCPNYILLIAASETTNKCIISQDEYSNKSGYLMYMR